MSTKYKATTTEEAYFITITTVGWIDVFTRLNQKGVIVNALNYCQKNKGLEIYAYCIMSSHIHIFCKATNGFILSDVLRDFKKFTSKKIIQTTRPLGYVQRSIARICNPCPQQYKKLQMLCL